MRIWLTVRLAKLINNLACLITSVDIKIDINVVLQSLLIQSTSFHVLIQKDSALFEKVEILQTIFF